MSRSRHTPADEPYFLARTLAAEFADGSVVAPHTHQWGQVIYAAAGVTTVWTEHGSWVVPPHWAVWVPAGISHGLRFTGAASLRTLYVRPDVTALGPTSAVVTISTLLRALILRATQIGMLDSRERAHVAMVDLIVDELSTPHTPALELPMPRSERLRRVADYLAQRPADHTTQATLATRFGVGARTLERGFAAETGLSFGRWRRQARFMYALRRLGAGMSVKRVAAEAGYRTPSAFIAAFRVALDTTPGRYFAAGRGA